MASTVAYSIGGGVNSLTVYPTPVYVIVHPIMDLMGAKGINVAHCTRELFAEQSFVVVGSARSSP